jgi:hypothetical protein
MSVDALSDLMPGSSPFHYCFNNPLILRDPSGLIGEIGSDGIPRFTTGEVVCEADGPWHHWWSNIEGARRGIEWMNGQGAARMGSPTAADRVGMGAETANTHARPDKDGYLTLDEANDWYRNGHGEALNVCLSKVDLSGVYTKDFGCVGSAQYFNLLTLRSGSLNDARVYGNIRLQLISVNEVVGFYDIYDFDMKSWNNPLNWFRNVETMIGKQYAGNGKPFRINFIGTARIESAPFPPR